MAVKHMILNEIPTTKILIIDVENEYNHLCKKLNGKVIECDGIDSGGVLNPLQVRINRDDEIGKNALSLHFQFLETFFQILYPSLTEIEENTTNENKEFNEKILIEIESYLKIKENTQMQIEDYKFLKAIAEELRRQEVRRTDISMPPLFVIKNSQGQEMFFITRKALNEYIECNKKSLSENKTIIEIPSNNSYELEKLIEIIKRNF